MGVENHPCDGGERHENYADDDKSRDAPADVGRATGFGVDDLPGHTTRVYTGPRSGWLSASGETFDSSWPTVTNV